MTNNQQDYYFIILKICKKILDKANSLADGEELDDKWTKILFGKGKNIIDLLSSVYTVMDVASMRCKSQNEKQQKKKISELTKTDIQIMTDIINNFKNDNS